MTYLMTVSLVVTTVSHCWSFDPKVVTITNDCSQNFYEQNGKLKLLQNISREYMPFNNATHFNKWLSEECLLPSQAHKIIYLCSNKTDPVPTVFEKLISLVITIALDPDYYIVKNPGVVYNNTRFSVPINKWVKQTNIALIHSSLPKHLTILLAKLMAFSRIPIIVNDLEITSRSSYNELLYSPNIKSNFMDKVAPLVQWEEVIMLHFIKEKKPPTDMLFVHEMMKSFMERRKTCIKVVEIRLNDRNKWNKTLDIFNIETVNNRKIIILIGNSYRTFKRYVAQYKDSFLPKRNFYFIGFGDDYCRRITNFHCIEIKNFIRMEFQTLSRAAPEILTRIPYTKLLDSVRLGYQFTTIRWTLNRFRNYLNYDFTLLRKELLATSQKILGSDLLAREIGTFGKTVNEKIILEYANDLRNKGYTKSKCATRKIVCSAGHFKTFGKLPKTKTNWNLEYGYYCSKCGKGLVTESFGEGPCYACPGYHLPNVKQTLCIDPFQDNFEWLNTTAGVIATILATVTCLLTSFIIGVFVRNINTPCVKISDKFMSFSHLFVILLSCIVLPALHLMKPSATVCTCRPLSIAVLYSLNVSIISVKSNKLVNCFLSKTRASSNEVLKTSLTQIFIVFINLIIGISLSLIMFEQTSPASNVHMDFKSYQRLIYCNTDSHTSVVIGFMVCSQLACFAQAFRCRNLPGYINEAMSITYATFITTVFFFVMFPIQFSRKNPQDGYKVQVLTLLGNTTVFLVSMYGRKTYFMLFQSHKNTTQFFRGKQMEAMRIKAKRIR